MKLLDFKSDRKGYLSVSMRQNGKLIKRTVARLVAEAFIGPRPAGQQVRHKDGIKSINHFTNLEYGTRSENELDKRRHGTAPIGSNHPCVKLTPDQVFAIRKRYIKGTRTDGCNALGRDYGVTGSQIGRIVRGQLWSHLQ